jgi:hypothetical protein
MSLSSQVLPQRGEPKIQASRDSNSPTSVTTYSSWPSSTSFEPIVSSITPCSRALMCG